ncbi:hypothetical protein HPP92_011177 [Vanilla planifolia]|uniref:Pentatricopeptide repeat-containing protein n=1 Tax=Vanilla planifolia TaxID=51239 RepID=A0A835RB07_VANPL|nr:hypothetical protein HPP92_011177 [Vanilla planifolia]
MEQTFSISRFSTSPPSKCFPKWRKRSTRNQILQAFQASLATAEKQSPLLRFPSHGSLKQVHAHLIKIGEEWNSCSLLDNLLQHMSSPELLEIFRGLHRDGVLFSDGEAAVKDVLLWSKAITLIADREEWLKVFDLFREMQFSNLRAEATTIQVLNVCGKAGALNSGKEIHGRAMRTDVLTNTVVCNSLITMYAKNSSMEAARRVFEYIDSPSLVSWNSMISGYCINGCLDDALKLFNEMISTGMQPDLVTWNCLFSVHHIDTSSEVIFELFRRMQVCGVKPNSTSMTSVLQVVCRLGKVGFGKEIHGYALRHGLTRSLYVSTALLDMYSNLFDL